MISLLQKMERKEQNMYVPSKFKKVCKYRVDQIVFDLPQNPKLLSTYIEL